MKKGKIEFKRNQKTGILETWVDGKKTGEILTMGDVIIQETKQEKSDQKNESKRKNPDRID